MKQALFSAVETGSISRLREAVEAKRSIALTGLPDHMTAFVAARLAAETGKRVLLVSGNDLRATHDADDIQQLLGAQGACLPGGEIDLTRGASSHESAWRRLETLSRVTRGEVRVLAASVDALVQRMGSADLFRQGTIRLRVGDVYDPAELLRDLTLMGYERVNMVEGKGQCAMRGAILDVYPPAGAQSLRIEFFDDEVDSIRAFDCISQRSQDRMEQCELAPATEVLLDETERSAGADRMRRAIRENRPDKPQEEAVFADLPPLPEDDADAEGYFDAAIAPRVQRQEMSATRRAELDRRTEQLLRDADAVENGMPFRRIRAWLTVLTEHTGTLMDWYRPDVVLLCDPDHLRRRAQERMNGFAEDLEAAMCRGEAVKEQQELLMSWDEVLQALQGTAVVTASEYLEGLGGVQAQDAVNLGAERVGTYSSQLRQLAADCRDWLEDGMRVAVLCGGVARGQRLCQSLRELEIPADFAEEVQRLSDGRVQILPGTLGHGFVWPEASLVVVSDTDVYGSGYRRAKSARPQAKRSIPSPTSSPVIMWCMRSMAWACIWVPRPSVPAARAVPGATICRSSIGAQTS